MYDWLSLNFSVLVILNYPISLLDFFGILSGLICVYTAAKNWIITWPVGIFNSICFFFLFYQVQLYSDMLLQVYFFGSSVYGWIYWSKREGVEIPITVLGAKLFILLLSFILFFSYLLGEFTIQLPNLIPKYFTLPPSYPYFDAFTTIASIVANFLLAKRILQSWYLWIAVDVVCISLYFLKGIDLVAMEYVVFLLIAIYGVVFWKKNSEVSSTH